MRTLRAPDIAAHRCCFQIENFVIMYTAEKIFVSARSGIPRATLELRMPMPSDRMTSPHSWTACRMLTGRQPLRFQQIDLLQPSDQNRQLLSTGDL
jgi:hypothetical protein